MKIALIAGTCMITLLWSIAVATPRWHTKSYYILGGIGAKLHLSLFNYEIECQDAAASILRMVGQRVNTDVKSAACEMGALNLLELVQSRLDAEPDPVTYRVVYGSLTMFCFALAAMACGFVGSCLVWFRPSSTALVFHGLSAGFGVVGLIVYVGCTNNLSDFFDPDVLKMPIVVNDADVAITLSWSFAIAATAAVLQCILAVGTWSFLGEWRANEPELGKLWNADQPWQEGQQPWQEQKQPAWQEQPGQPWAAPEPQWGAPQAPAQQPQQWGAPAPPAQQWR